MNKSSSLQLNDTVFILHFWLYYCVFSVSALLLSINSRIH